MNFYAIYYICGITIIIGSMFGIVAFTLTDGLLCFLLAEIIDIGYKIKKPLS